MKKKKIINYLDNSFLSLLSIEYKKKLNNNISIELKYFYWLYKNVYIRNIKGLIINFNKKQYLNMESFLLYYRYKNIRLNQLYFVTSPFNLFLKYKISNIKKYKLYIL